MGIKALIYGFEENGSSFYNNCTESFFIQMNLCKNMNYQGFPDSWVVKICLPIQDMWVWSHNAGDVGQEDSQRKEMATHSSILAWKIPWTEEPEELLFMGSQKSLTWLSDWKTKVNYQHSDALWNEDVVEFLVDQIMAWVQLNIKAYTSSLPPLPFLLKPPFPHYAIRKS